MELMEPCLDLEGGAVLMERAGSVYPIGPAAAGNRSASSRVAGVH